MLFNIFLIYVPLTSKKTKTNKNKTKQGKQQKLITVF